MKPVSLFIVFLSIIQLNFGQLNTKTKTNEDGGTTITSYHKNGKASVVEVWDKEKRWGSMKGYNNEGKELFSYDLRKFAGHASVYLSYYANGQVKKAEYSSMPDGGIQWYRYIHEFDETGNQTSYIDLSMPDGHPTTLTTYKDTTGTNKPIVEIKKPELVERSTPYITEFTLVNETKKTVTLTIKAKDNLSIQLKDTVVTLKPHQSILFNSTTHTKFLPETCFEPQTKTGKQKKERYKFLFGKPSEEKNTRTYTWHVLGK